VCERIGAEPARVLLQCDTYFEVSRGRLKLREQPPEVAQLIAYERADEARARESRFQIVTVAEPEALAAVLADTLGIRARVAKRRELYMWRGVRIHLDEVEELGDFIEFEAPVDADASEADARARVAQLRDAFGVRREDVVARSYCELARAR
jgi:adenylate cyclase class 2